MTMTFRTYKDAIVSLLVSEAAGRYRVRGFLDQNLSAEEVADTDRLVQVYYSSGSFSKSSSGRGPFDHAMTFKIMLVASKAAQADLTVLNDPAATPSELATALADAELAAEGADEALDELIDAVFQVIMAGTSLDLGLGTKVSSRWLERIEKTDPFPRGDRVVVSATIELTCRALEEVASATLTDLEFVSLDHQIQGDDTVRAGVEVEPDGN